MKKVCQLIALLVLSSVLGCKSVTKQTGSVLHLDASQESEIEGTGTSSTDIRIMAERMARDLAAEEFATEKNKVRIALGDIVNETRIILNPNIIKDRLLADLMEFTRNSKLQFTENPSVADFYLTARITSRSIASSAGVNDYILYTFKLLDKMDTVVWVGKPYETKKVGKTGVIYR